MFPNYFLFPYFMPYIPNDLDRPVTVYALLESLVNYGKEDKTKIRNLAKEGRTKIFDFDYPLSNYVNKEEFETNILNHFIKRRIGFQTVTDFKIHLEVKLNEIMPMYNKMFDVLENWNIFESEKTIHDSNANRDVDTTSNNSSERNTENTNKTTTELSNETSNNTNVTDDKRYSQLPQSEIQNVQNASYLTDYTYTQNETTSEDNSTSNGSSNATNNTNENFEENGSNKTKDKNIVHEETIKTNPTLMYEYLEKMKNIYSMIYKDLDCLFYQLI